MLGCPSLLFDCSLLYTRYILIAVVSPRRTLGCLVGSRGVLGTRQLAHSDEAPYMLGCQADSSGWITPTLASGATSCPSSPRSSTAGNHRVRGVEPRGRGAAGCPVLSLGEFSFVRQLPTSALPPTCLPPVSSSPLTPHTVHPPWSVGLAPSTRDCNTIAIRLQYDCNTIAL